ncbi:hypothetical protein SDC9_111999 [bioreactor metagenome]|uniref:Uncharacterized protein n=1 Tax=bioreactor metagenome TaxID=1076179 RepID=A0A645BIB2_9ZZZZ
MVGIMPRNCPGARAGLRHKILCNLNSAVRGGNRDAVFDLVAHITTGADHRKRFNVIR